MTEWPEAPVLRACLEWNETERKRAMADVTNKSLKVPTSVTKTVKGDKVVLTADEYREQRKGDADRFARNIVALKERL